MVLNSLDRLTTQQGAMQQEHVFKCFFGPFSSNMVPLLVLGLKTGSRVALLILLGQG